jgi:Na+-translocating ferredoxin:NAD+ oxidoreductase RnfC subunit
LKDVALGAALFAEAAGAPRTLLCLKERNAKLLGLSQGEPLDFGVKAQILPDAYPVGDEVVLTHEALGRVVPPGKLPSSAGAVSINAETALNIRNALQEGVPVTEKWLTVGGAVDSPCVVKAPIGANVSELFSLLGAKAPEGFAVLDGGPAMGRIVGPETAVVSKTTKALIVLPESSPAVILKRADSKRLLRRASSACCQCSFCTDICPRGLLGYPLSPHLAIRSAVSQGAGRAEPVLGASLCSGCNLCSFAACCQGVAPSVVMDRMKRALSETRASFQLSLESASPFRQSRMIPSSRFERLVGAAPYESPTPFRDIAVKPKELRIPLLQHAGKMSVPVVSAGDCVSAGQTLAEPAQGVSAAQHSPVDGFALRVSDDSIYLKARG